MHVQARGDDRERVAGADRLAERARDQEGRRRPGRALPRLHRAVALPPPGDGECEGEVRRLAEGRRARVRPRPRRPHLVIPDRPGNKRLDGMRNLLQNPHAGMIFLIPGREETLRVNGRASIIRDAEILESLTAHGKRPLVAIGLEVEECFFHCPKAFRRSELWNPERWLDRAALPSVARVLFEQVRPAGKTVEEYERESEEGLKRTLY